jgi:hypothetical protein
VRLKTRGRKASPNPALASPQNEHSSSLATPQPTNDLGAIVRGALHSRHQPLDPDIRASAETGYGHDFSEIQVHANDQAARAAEALNARAFALGRHIVFGRDSYQPQSPAGRHLILHELAHVQQASESMGAAVPGRVRVSHPAEDRERQAENAANRLFGPARLQPASHRPPAAAPVTDVLFRAPATEQARAPSWETALLVLQAISDVLNARVEVREGVGYPRGHPRHHPDVPEEYQSLLMDWYRITHPTQRLESGAIVRISGEHLHTHLDLAMAKTRPLIDILVAEGDENTKPWLQRNFYARVNQFRSRATREEVSEALSATVKRRAAAGQSFEALTDIEAVRAILPDALQTVRQATTLVTRHTNQFAMSQAEGYALQLRLDKMFQDAARSVPNQSPLLQAAKTMTLPMALMHVKGGLDGLNAIVSVADPERRAELLRKRSDLFGALGAAVEIEKIVLQFVSGAVAIAGASTYAVASLLGKSALAAQVLTRAMPALNNLNFMLNGLYVIRGALVLLDSDASAEEKVNALLEIGVGGAGVVGRFVSGFSFPATFSVVVNFYLFTSIVKQGMQFYEDLIRLGLNICYADMQKNARFVHDTALRAAIATDMVLHETDPARNAEFARAAEGLKWNLREQFLLPYIKRATTWRGAGNADTGSYEPLRRRFLPLADRPVDTDEQLFQLSVDFLEIVAKCIVDAEQIFRETANWHWKHRGARGVAERERATRAAQEAERKRREPRSEPAPEPVQGSRKR